MAYVDIYDQATTASTLKKKVAVALFQASVNILNEDPQTANHTNRVYWANRVLLDPVAWADKAIWKVMENSTIAASPATATDSDVQFVINSAVDSFLRML